MAKRSKSTESRGFAGLILRFARASMRFVAGLLVGLGLMLYGQLQTAELMREQVQETFWLWRNIGHATFFLQGTDVQVALLLSTIADEHYQHSNRVALTLMIVGGCLLFAAAFVRQRPKRP